MNKNSGTLAKYRSFYFFILFCFQLCMKDSAF